MNTIKMNNYDDDKSKIIISTSRLRLVYHGGFINRFIFLVCTKLQYFSSKFNGKSAVNQYKHAKVNATAFTKWVWLSFMTTFLHQKYTRSTNFKRTIFMNNK